MKKYMDIERLKDKYVDGFETGDFIVIQEKIDGANFSIKYDKETDSILAFSRKKELNFKETLRGAWNFSQTLDKDLVKTLLGDNLVLFGEWLVKHTVTYPNDKYQKAYFYDVYDVEKEEWLTQGEVDFIIKQLGVMYVPILYVGEFRNWNHIKEYVGTTRMGGEYGEGIVVKNMTKLNNPNQRLPFYTKIVCDEFCETKTHRDSKPIDIDKINETNRLKESTATIVTQARVRKMLNKFVDEGIIPEDWDEKSMGIIAQNIGRSIYNDCVKEENDTVVLIGALFGKFASSISMSHVKQILKER